MKDNSNRVVTLVLLGWLCFAVGLGGWFHNASAPAVAATVLDIPSISPDISGPQKETVLNFVRLIRARIVSVAVIPSEAGESPILIC